MSLIGKLAKARAELDAHQKDPWHKKVEAAVRGKDAVSTAAILDLMDEPKTTSNARRAAKIMRELGYIPLKSRKFLPGGFRDSVSRGWSRPFRMMKSSPTINTALNQQGMVP